MEVSDAYTRGYVDGFYGRPPRSEEEAYRFGYATGQMRNRRPSDGEGGERDFEKDGSR